MKLKNLDSPTEIRLGRTRSYLERGLALLLFLTLAQGCSQSLTGATSSSSSEATPEQRFKAAKSVLAAHCISCHRSGGVAGQARLDFDTEAEFVIAGVAIPKDADGSPVIRRSIYSGIEGEANMPTGGGSFTSNDHKILVDWIEGMNQQEINTTGFECDDPSVVSPSHATRLSKTQYKNTLEDIFGTTVLNAASASIALLPDDDERYFSANLDQVSGAHAQAYMDIALQIADTVLASSSLTTQVFGSCAGLVSPPSNCIDTYIAGTARKIFRRPLTSAEATETKSIAQSTGDFSTNLRRILAWHLVSPSFLLITELGSADLASSSFELTGYEVATRLAYRATNSTPDTELLNAARDGLLKTQEQTAAQALRLFSTPRGKSQVRRMFRHWLEQLGGIDITQLPAELKTGLPTSGLNTAAFTEQDAFIDYLIWEQNAGFEELLTSKVSLASHSGLAAIYGHTALQSSRISGGPVAEFDGRRQGILMRLSFLGSSKPRTNLVSRGVRIRRQVLCEELPSPTGEAVSEREDLEPSEALRDTMSTASYITHLTNSSVCLSCHTKINPTGISFEGLDPLGRLRTSEALFATDGSFIRNVPVETSGEVPMWEGTEIRVTDAYDLVDRIAQSPEGVACFTRQTFRYFHHRKELAQDSCELKSIYSELTKSNPSILDAFVSAIANEATTLRRTQ